MTLRVLLAIFLFVAGTTEALTPPATVLLDELTWTELRDRIAAGSTTIIIPIGGTEQNGPHMALGKHNARVKFIAEKIAQKLGNTIVAPVIAYVPEGRVDPPLGHMRFPGTISVSDDAFRKVLESAARSFRQHGFRDIVFIGDHGDYQKSMQLAATTLNREWSKSRTPIATRAHAIEEYYRASSSGFAQLLQEKGFRDEEIGIHAGLADTSLTLAVDPNLLRADRMAQPAASADGVRGDPRRASAELGRIGIDLIVNKTVAAIHKAIQR